MTLPAARPTPMLPGRREPLLLWLAIAAKLIIFALTGSRYGYLADELYFLDAAEHLSWGYVDFPPMIAWLMAALKGLGADSLLVLRAVACAIGIAVVVLSVEVARLLGGGRVAQTLTAVVVIFAPAFLSIQSILTMNVLDQLWWVAGFVLLIRYLLERRPPLALALGGVWGLSLLTKLALPAWLLALAATASFRARWVFRRPEVLAAILIAALLASPFAIWQAMNGWPFLEFVRAYNASPPEAMVIDQPLFGLIATMNPPFLLIWLPGLIWGLIARDELVRLLGTAAFLCLALFMLVGVKFYFATPLFVLFSAFGALLWERWLEGHGRRARVFVATMVLSGVVAVPIGAPVLPPAILQQVADFIRDGEQGRPGTGPAPLGRYFPHFAEMHGWPELVAAVSRHYLAIPEEDRGRVGLLAAYFGQAGALNQLDREDRLPPAYSGHMSYHLWSEEAPLDDVLAVGFEPELLERLYREVQVLEQFHCARCMARENTLIIARARNPAVDSDEIRRQIKRFYFF